jgi:hypothetical protein
MVKNKKKQSAILYYILKNKSLSNKNSTNSVKISESIGKILFLQHCGYKEKNPHQTNDEDLIESEFTSD